MESIAFVVGLLVISLVLRDAFETIILPRQVRRRVRVTRLVYMTSWPLFRAIARRTRNSERREALLAYFGPLSLIFLLGTWAVALIFSFALLNWATGSQVNAPDKNITFATLLYESGTTFFTLGPGDVTPRSDGARLLMVAEAATGFGVLAIVIGYLPVLYQAFSRREVSISMLDARAGSPPTASELLRRHCGEKHSAALEQLLYDWERWSAELLESHLSYPTIAFFRSQHDRQSWLAALTTLLDTCALVQTGIEGASPRPARLAFAMARHAAVDLAQVFNTHPQANPPDRLPPATLALLRESLLAAGIVLQRGPEADRRLTELRAEYEPFVDAISTFLLMPLPPWLPAEAIADDWETTGWRR